MPLSFFYEENLPDANQFVLSEVTSRHIIQVLRMQEGSQILLTDGKGQMATAEIIAAHKKKAEVKIVHKDFVPQQKNSISIAISIIKNTSRFEWFLEKATEIGVYAIIPLLCKRTEKTHFREERMRAILISAMLQSRQAWLPQLGTPVHFNELIKTGTSYSQKFIAHCVQEEKKELNHLTADKASSSIILIGPEGDFTNDEIKAAIQLNYIPVSLGETRLRTETAGLVAAVLLR